MSNAAYSKARQKIRHTAFIELNQKAIVETTYQGDYATCHGFRILAVDGSKIILPTSLEIAETFGTQSIANQQAHVGGTYSFGLASVLYDVLSCIALDARLTNGNAYEVTEAEHHLTHVDKGDLVLFDRGYCSYRMMASMAQTKADFLIRCHSQSFSVVNTMFRGEGASDVTVTIEPSAPFLAKHGQRGLPTSLKVRFIRVLLDTGEIEVLATSLLDTTTYPPGIFKDLYWKRWGVETFYGILKTRLCLENFSGVSVESIRQEFYATVFLSGLESLLTEETNGDLAKKETQYPQQVNKAVSFNAIKGQAFALFLGDQSSEDVLTVLTQLFLKSPTLYRKDRLSLRRVSSSTRVLNFWKRRKKFVF